MAAIFTAEVVILFLLMRKCTNLNIRLFYSQDLLNYTVVVPTNLTAEAQTSKS